MYLFTVLVGEMGKVKKKIIVYMRLTVSIVVLELIVYMAELAPRHVE